MIGLMIGVELEGLGPRTVYLGEYFALEPVISKYEGACLVFFTILMHGLKMRNLVRGW